MMRAAEKPGVADCGLDCIWPGKPVPPQQNTTLALPAASLFQQFSQTADRREEVNAEITG